MSASAVFDTALLVEDEPNLVTSLTVALKKLGISVSHVSTIEAAQEFIRKNAPSLVVLDRNLPDGDGLSLCKELRSSRAFHGMILMLTARGDTADRVSGLNAGADDYLAKPFSWSELEARIRALFRRAIPPTPLEAPIDDPLWHFDEGQLRLLGPNGWVNLTPLEYKLAHKLIDAKGSIVSREDLLKDVWGFTLLPKTRTVDHFLGRLRKYFEVNADDPKHFLTVRGAGYRFER